jgi:drug/metabolite transporter (DMT)-like permease
MSSRVAESPVELRPDVSALAAALVTVTLWGSAFVAIRDAGRSLSPGPLALGRLLVSLVVLGVAARIWRLPLFAPGLVGEVGDAGAAGIGWILYLGVAPTALGFATWAYALRRMSAGRLASVTYLIPVVAILLGWALLGETPPWLAAVGGALCVAGVYVARR